MTRNLSRKKQLEEHITNAHGIAKEAEIHGSETKEYKCNNCDYKTLNIDNMKNHCMGHEVYEYKFDTCDHKSADIAVMKKHVKLHNQEINCKACQYKSKDEHEFIEHAIKYHSYSSKQTQRQTSGEVLVGPMIECYSCGEKLATKWELTVHRKQHHFKERLCKFYHGNGSPCRFPDNICIDIHDNRQYETVPQQQQTQQRQSVIQPNSQYRKRIPCRDGSNCVWSSSQEGCRYYHTEGKAQETTTALSSDQLKELIQLVQVGLNLRENVPSVPQTNSITDFPGLEYSKSKSV